ncbi:MAG: hypothetical protein SAJ12_02610 [Jaaginema sp. PMC 1079.18]|nr:hypothetical protein [Jaaginema sp. PMC 1080.18]MEC4849881.1 hypothetical protein [Jaaginema sp. PMC 1079.18]MEC4866870.1 hypothetical protein [Jaaginema sp. PMC 1078.18]
MKPEDTQQLDQQIQTLIDNAPAEAGMGTLLAEAVTPTIRAFALQMQHLDYYVLQSADGGWVLTTLRNRQQPQVEKKVVYAFSTHKDALEFARTATAKMIPMPIAIAQILFQLFALDPVDSIVFLETPGDLVNGTEVHRADLQKLVQQQLREFQKQSNLPPDMA